MDGPYLLPTDACARCERTLDQTGGSRVVMPRFWSENEITEAGGAFKAAAEMHDGKRPVEVVETAPSDWTQEDLDRVEENSLRANIEGRRPWLCQSCTHRLCRECGEPLAGAPCADVIHDDGSIWHSGHLAYLGGCVNPACKDHRGHGRMRRLP